MVSEYVNSDDKLESKMNPKQLILEKSLPVHVYIDADIRSHLGMRNSDRKARILLPLVVDELTVTFIRQIIEHKFPPLYHQQYILRYQPLPDLLVPEVVNTIGNKSKIDLILNQSASNSIVMSKAVVRGPKQFTSDDELISFFRNASRSVPSIQLFVDVNPCLFPPPPINKPYLHNMKDPMESDSFTLISFYKFADIEQPDEFALALNELWKPFRAVGRVYVAKEGVNAQMAIPTNVLQNFKSCTETLSVFRGNYLNAIDESIPYFYVMVERFLCLTYVC